MKTAAMLNALAATLLLSASDVFAASAGRIDHSGLVVWTFLGFCGLILVAQLLPAVLMLIGAAKALQDPANSKAPASHG